MFKNVLVVLVTILIANVIIGGTFVANATEESVRLEETTQRDPLGDPEVSKPELGDMFRFDQNITLSSISAEANVNVYVEVTPNDICYMVSEANGKGMYRIYVEGMDPSIKVYTHFWRDTEFTIIQRNALIAGDLNADASIDAFDLVLVRRLLIESIKGNDVNEISIIRADFNRDCKFNIVDLVALQRFLLGYKEVVDEADEVIESDYIAVKSISPHGFAGSSSYVVSLFDNGDLTVNSKLYAVNVIDIGLDVDGQGIIMQGGEILASQEGWIRQSNETPPVVGESSGITIKPTGFSGCSQHFVCLTSLKQLYIDGNFYADGVEQVYVETDESSQDFGAVICRGGYWYNDSPGWVVIVE